jgi:CubicO group peptidase (beta-lactamase class C family)
MRQAHGIPGLAISVIQPDTIISAWSGTKRINHDLPLSADSKFHLGSNTKAITAYIAMQLVQDNRIALNTRFFSLFPELKRNSKSVYYDITLQQLLQHQARIPPFTSGLEFESLPPMKGTPGQNRYHFASEVLTHKPVKVNTYSNAGYGLASLMLEKVSGKSYETLVAELCEQLGLDHCTGLPNRQDSTGIWGHWMENGELTALPPDHNYNLPDYLRAAGDVSMSISDYSVWVQYHLNGLTGRANGLDSSAYNLMHFDGETFGLGWGHQIKPARLSFHDGTTGTFYAHTIIAPDQKTALVVLTNSAEKNHTAGIYALRELVFKEIFASRKQ